jgi:PAS domain S-box-containing protein
MTAQTVDQLLRENQDLRHRLEEAEDALRAVQAGEVDAVLVEGEREQVYTLETADKPYRLLVEQVRHGAATLTTDGAIIYCNRRFAELLGRPVKSLLGKPIGGFVAPDSRPLLEALLRDGQTAEVQGEVLLQRADGPAPAYLNFSPLHEGALGLCLMVTDLSEQRHYQELKRTQVALRDSERRFREMIDALPVAIYTTDLQGRLTHFNSAAVEFSGRAPEIGVDSWCVTWKLYRPDGTPLPSAECAMALVLKEGCAVGGEETIAERPDGTRVWFMSYPRPLLNTEGRLVGAINMLLDITERKQGEQAAALLSAIVDSSDDAIISKDLNGIITSWNQSAERLFGYSAEEAIGQSITMLIPADRPDEEAEILNRLKRGERVDDFDTIRIRKDRSLVQVSLTISPIRDSERRIVGASKIARDITARKKMEAALKEADRRKDEFLATLAHELRNPLAPIRNAVQILKVKGPPDPELKWGREVIDRQVQVMARLLEDLLDVSRISRNRLELRKERVELVTVVEAALETSRPVIEAGSHELTVALPPEPIPLEADPVRLAQVFTNLLNNAAKYTEEGGRIRLSVERQGSDVKVSVLDNGIGIIAEMLPRVFDIFAQSPRALLRSPGGLGIGLSLVKGLVELPGGSIEARSEGAGRGSEFVVRLPVAVAKPLPAAAPPKEDGEPKPATKCRILIVDDNEDSADSLAMLLKIKGYEVETAYDGVQAVEAAGTLRPNVVLLDIGMPKLNGYDACWRIRQQPWGQGMFLIALTGWGQEEDRRRTEEAGFNQHMVKPVDPAALMKLLASLSVQQGGQLSKRGR